MPPSAKILDFDAKTVTKSKCPPAVASANRPACCESHRFVLKDTLTNVDGVLGVLGPLDDVKIVSGSNRGPKLS